MTKEKRSAWRKANPEKHREEQALYRKRHPKRIKKRMQDYRSRHPEKAVKNQAAYRTRRTQAGGSFSTDEWKTLCREYHHLCACCGRNKKLTVDHVIPVSKGGTSNIANIQPLCKSCNSRKKDGTTDFRLRFRK